MKSYLLILDPAHGIDVPGKQSPDGSFIEWSWSRMMIRKMIPVLTNPEYPFDVYSPFLLHDIEPGLSTRVKAYNDFADQFSQTIMISIHVDAFKGQWWDGTGFSFFTSKDENFADRLANVMARTFERSLPRERIRRNSPQDASKDENFTVIAGTKVIKPKYHGILVENLFMDSYIDITKLKDYNWQDRLVKTYHKAVVNMFDYMLYGIETTEK